MNAWTPDALLARIRALPRAVVVGIAALLGAIVLASIACGLAGRTQRVALFATALHDEQLAEVQERLAEWNVPYVPQSDNMLIDAASRNSILLRLSLAGVPHPHVQTSAETLANVGVLTPQAVVESQERAGLAGDIESGLRNVDGVDDARVIVAPAHNAEFADESARAATASVRLTMHPGATLAPQAVAGVRQFVAASVAGLSPSNVTILDDRGIALTDVAHDDDADDLAHSLQTALDGALGSGVAIVRVHVERAHVARVDHEVERIALGGTIAREASSERYATNDKHYAKSDEHDDRGSTTRTIDATSDPQAIKSVSTAIFLDADRVADVASVRALAAATVGFNAQRGDSLTVEAVAFHRPREPRGNPWMLVYAIVTPLLPALAVLGCTIVVTRAALPALRSIFAVRTRHIAREHLTESVRGHSPARVRSALLGEPPHAAAAVISALPTATAAAVLEMYPIAERQAIVARMQRGFSTVIPTPDEVLAHHA